MARSCYWNLERPRQPGDPAKHRHRPGLAPRNAAEDRPAALELPALFVWGAKDQLPPADVARDLAERIIDANLVVDAGDIPHIDQADAVATAINGFPREPAPQQSGTARARSARERSSSTWHPARRECRTGERRRPKTDPRRSPAPQISEAGVLQFRRSALLRADCRTRRLLFLRAQ
jgi:hypothetical protein